MRRQMVTTMYNKHIVNRCSGRMAEWLEAVLLSLEEVGVQVQIPAWLVPIYYYYYFLSSFFYPLAFYCLFSLPTLLASRDFCKTFF